MIIQVKCYFKNSIKLKVLFCSETLLTDKPREYHTHKIYFLNNIAMKTIDTKYRIYINGLTFKYECNRTICFNIKDIST